MVVPPTALASPGSRALVVGSGRHVPGSALPDVPAVDRTVEDLSRLLVERCGLAPENLWGGGPLLHPRDPIVLGDALTEVAQQATDVLLIHYVGHGLVSPGNELYLATQATDDLVGGLAFKALPYQALREALSGCRARSVIVVLDCCFAGRAHGALGTAAAHAFELASLGGTYVLASSSADEQSLAPEGDRYTAFTGALIELLRDGDPAGLPQLTTEDVYRRLCRVLPRRGLPAPHRHLSDRAGDLVLAPNPAATAPSTAAETGAPDEAEQDGQPPPPCPYRGLHPFTAEDSPYFFGRERLVAELLRTMSQASDTGGPIAVVGPSGVGKSSLLHAGLLPAVQHGRLRIPGSQTWPRLSLTPGAEPLASLARRLAPIAGTTPDECAARLREDPDRLRELVRRALRVASGGRDAPGGRLLLLVDQFEELFTLCPDEDERGAFIKALGAACRSSDASQPPPAMVVIGVRADFYGRCLTYPELAAALRERQLPVVPMTPDELRDAIEKPAEATGLRLEAGLSDTVLRDIGSRQDPGDATAFGTGSLPLLSYALQRTWAVCGGRTLTLAGYAATGGVWNAVTKQADTVYESLSPDARRAARTLLLRMVHVGKGTEDTRRRISLAELLASRPPEEAAALVSARDALAEARLITLDGDRAEIAHEALLRVWPRLRRWIDEDHTGLLVHQQLADAADDWQAAGRDRTLLYGGTRLATARQWFAAPQHEAALTPHERRFLTASLAAQRRRRWGLAGIALAVVAALLGGLVAVTQYRTAAHRQNLITSRQLAQLADQLRDGDPGTARQLALAAYGLAPTKEARSSLLASYVTRYPVMLKGHTDRVLDTVFRRDGRLLATSSKDRTIRLWDVADPNRPAPRGVLHTDGTAAIAFSPDGSLLAARTWRSFSVWNVRSPGHPVVRAVRGSPADTDAVPRVAFSADGRTVAASGATGTVQMWDVRDPAHPGETSLAVGKNEVTAVAFSPDGKVLATANGATSRRRNSAAVRLWNVTAPHKPELLAMRDADSALSLAFSRRGDLLAAGGALGSIAVWDVHDPGHPATRDVETFSGNDNSVVMSLSFTADGSGFAAANSTGTVDYWEITGSGSGSRIDLFNSLPGKVPVYAVASSPDGAVIASGGDKGMVSLWSKAVAQPLPGTISSPGSGVPGKAFSEDGRLIAVSADYDSAVAGKTAAIWQISDPHRPALAAGLPRPWTRAVFLPHGRLLISQSQDSSSLALWDLTDPRHPVHLSTFRAEGGATVTGDGRTLVAGNATDSQATVWDITNPRRPSRSATIPLHATGKDSEVELQFLDPTTLLIYDDGGTRLWDLHDVRRPSRGGDPLRDFHEGIAGEAFDPRTRMLALWSFEGPLRLVSISDIRRPGKPAQIDGQTNSAGFLDDTTLAIATKNDKSVSLWDVGSRARPQKTSVLPAQARVSELVVSPDGRFVAAHADMVDEIQLWDVGDKHDPNDLGTLAGVSAMDVQFSPDARTLALTETILPGNRPGVLLMSDRADDVYDRMCSANHQVITERQWLSTVGRIAPYRRPCGH
ncbi:caspase, EACC1-associated type [Streptomyces misionensis]|uniref:caspase, EACC1-associated type n=1 Tax=Streptomyces misionensis TaxID=67331 RepID=UPI003407DA69